MTRSNFLADMFNAVYGWKGIELSQDNSDNIEYKIGGSFIKDCTYSMNYKQRVQQMILCLFEERSKTVKIEGKGVILSHILNITIR